MTPEEVAEIQMCDECISHLMENAGPDHIIVKYRTALIKLQEQVEEIKRLEEALVEERVKQLDPCNGECGKEDDPDCEECENRIAREQLRAEGVIR